MSTLRQRLTLSLAAKADGATLVVSIPDAPSYIHNWDFAADDDAVTFTWDDEGQVFEAEFDLDDEPDDEEIRVYKLVEVQ